MRNFIFKGLFLGLSVLAINANAQIDTSAIEEDFSMYDDMEEVGETKAFCSPKIFDLSPNRFISIGYDFMPRSAFNHSDIGEFADDSAPSQYTNSALNTGLRVNANIPVISKSSVIWQLGGGYNRTAYNVNRNLDQRVGSDYRDSFLPAFSNGLTSINLNTTLFKPLSEHSFLIAQVMVEQNGSFNLAKSGDALDLNNTRLSASVLYGKRPHDRKQWAFGVSRTYRAGELNYIPVVMYNYTSENRKWGTEILFPARASYRRKFNPRSILLLGYELEGRSYRLYNMPTVAKNYELRRSEIRFRADYQKQLKGFVWLGIQAGVRQNYSFNVDDLGESNTEFFRGFFGDQSYAMKNKVGTVPYINVSINLVSP